MPISFFLIESDAYDGSEINRFLSKYPEEAYTMSDTCHACLNPYLEKAGFAIDAYGTDLISLDGLHIIDTLLAGIDEEVQLGPDEWTQDHQTHPTGTQYLHFTKTRLLSCIAGFRQLDLSRL